MASKYCTVSCEREGREITSSFRKYGSVERIVDAFLHVSSPLMILKFTPCLATMIANWEEFSKCSAATTQYVML